MKSSIHPGGFALGRIPIRPIGYARAHRANFLRQLGEFVRFPSVSAQPAHAPDLKRCALWLAEHLRQIGMHRVMLVPTDGNPLVFASWTRRSYRPTLLIYGHYDVQPADQKDGWASPPFIPSLRRDNFYGRGASDDKGQLFVHLKAIDSWMRSTGALPVNVKCIFEGEEESGSSHLFRCLDRIRPALKADVAVISDMAIPAPDRPAITFGLRGSLDLELEVRGPQHDLHSGQYGGAVHNPAQALCEILAQLHDHGGRITIPGFYDSVHEWSKPIRQYLAKVALSDAQIRESANTNESWGEDGYTLYERTTLRPSLDITSIHGGYGGPGKKAIIPRSASARIGFRLVPDQRATDIEKLVWDHLARITPTGVRLRGHTLSRAEPASFDPSGRAIGAAARAYACGFGRAPVFLRSGGTIPVANYFSRELGLPTVLMGFGLPDDGAHAPNEKFYLPNFERGIVTSICFLANLAKHPFTRSSSENSKFI